MADQYFESSLDGQEIEERLKGLVRGDVVQNDRDVHTDNWKARARSNIGTEAYTAAEKATVEQLSIPLPIEKGGTGATSATSAIHALSGKSFVTVGPISSGSPITLTFSGIVRLAIFFSGNRADRQGFALVTTSSTSTIFFTPIMLGSQITCTVDGNRLNIAASGTVYAYVMCLTEASGSNFIVS